jgi:hypothetical protein
VIVQCNRGDANPAAYADRVADVVLAGRFSEPPPVADGADRDGSGPVLTATELERWAGLYRREDRPEYVGFTVRDGTLSITQGGGGPLTPSDATTFRTRGGTEVAFSGDAGAGAVTMGERRYLRIPATTRSPDELEEVAGRYHSPELDVVWTLDTDTATDTDSAADADTGGLGVTLPGGERLPFRPGAPDEYVGVVTLTVVRDQGRVTGLRVYAGRVTGIVFERLDPPPASPGRGQS